MKLRVGIIFGGSSREREISFAGGRTVYDNLNKSLFEAVPLFIDSFRNFVLLDWQYIYKGSIRDFYPPVKFIPPSRNGFQVYAESVTDKESFLSIEMINSIGKKIKIEELNTIIDFAFLCLHGPYGEDGQIQGLLETSGIPYSGSGIFSSAFGMNKSLQKILMPAAGFKSPKYFSVGREKIFEERNRDEIFEEVKTKVGFPCVVKPANQGSSIGVSILENPSAKEFRKALLNAFFIEEIFSEEWKNINNDQRVDFVRTLADIREGIGMPVMVTDALVNPKHVILHPEELMKFIAEQVEKGVSSVCIEGVDSESEVIIESFINGKEFSCIVIRNENGEPVALPPTEIRKGNRYFDYRSKYLPGLSRKITPINLPAEQIEKIRNECERLFLTFGFNVYARIDGFIKDDGEIFLNDPNTTSGMMPSSFFCHQAAEIGLSPSQFLTYIIRTSLSEQITLQKIGRAHV